MTQSSTSEVDTLNRFMVASDVTSGGVIVMHPPVRGQVLLKADALALAAWLVAMTEAEPGPDFDAYLAAVKSS